MYEIVKGRAIPANVAAPSSAARSKYPWATMEIGDAFFVPGEFDRKLKGTMLSAASRTGHVYAPELGATHPETGEPGVYIFRVEGSTPVRPKAVKAPKPAEPSGSPEETKAVVEGAQDVLSTDPLNPALSVVHEAAVTQQAEVAAQADPTLTDSPVPADADVATGLEAVTGEAPQVVTTSAEPAVGPSSKSRARKD